jgi:hypothetical protein
MWKGREAIPAQGIKQKCCGATHLTFYQHKNPAYLAIALNLSFNIRHGMLSVCALARLRSLQLRPSTKRDWNGSCGFAGRISAVVYQH